MELVNDELGLMAALAGTPFIIEGEPLADPIAAVIVATIIAVNAAGLFRENFSMLLGGHPGKDHIRHLDRLSRAVPGVISIHELWVEYLGSESIHVDLHVVVCKDLTVDEADAIPEEVCRGVESFTGKKYRVLHLDTASQAEEEKPGTATGRIRDDT